MTEKNLMTRLLVGFFASFIVWCVAWEIRLRSEPIVLHRPTTLPNFVDMDARAFAEDAQQGRADRVGVAWHHGGVWTQTYRSRYPVTHCEPALGCTTDEFRARRDVMFFECDFTDVSLGCHLVRQR